MYRILSRLLLALWAASSRIEKAKLNLQVSRHWELKERPQVCGMNSRDTHVFQG